MQQGRRAALASVAVIALALTACGGSTAATSGAGTHLDPSAAGSVTTTRAPLPAGRYPSVIATMVCAKKAQGEIARVLGVTAHVATPTWSDHLYSCRYDYPDGSFVLSIKELSSWSETMRYFRSLGGALGDRGALGNLGQGAFTTTDGSVVVRKDWKVLLVNIAPLPAQFGRPPTSRADIGFTVADLILGCWDGD